MFTLKNYHDLSLGDQTLIGSGSDVTEAVYLQLNAAPWQSVQKHYPVVFSPGEDTTYLKVEYASEVLGNVFISGRSIFGEFRFGFDENGLLSGYGRGPSGRFTIYPVLHGLSVFEYRDDPPGYLSFSDSCYPDGTPACPIPNVVPDYECAATVDVLFILNPEVEFGKYETFKRIVESSVDRCNETLRRSKIGPKQIYPIIHSAPLALDIPIDATGISCGAAIQALKSNSNIEALRQQYEADMVVYYVPNLLNCLGVAGGIGVDYYSSLSVIDINAEKDAEYKVLTHELGHLWGGIHCQSWMFGAGYATQVSTVGPETVEPYYSNPNVNFSPPDGSLPVATGVIDIHHNARIIASYFCPSANFSESGGFRSILNVDYQLPECDQISLSVSVTETTPFGLGASPYTYIWEFSECPMFTSSTIFSTDPNPVFVLPSQDRVFYVRVTIISNGLIQNTNVAAVNICPTDTYTFESQFARSNEDLASVSSLVEVGVKSTLTISHGNKDISAISCGVDKGYHLILYDSKGSIALLTSELRMSKLELPVYLPSGLYFMQCLSKDGKQISSTSLIIP